METLRILNGRYHLQSVIKRGGFGTIYKGHDSVLGKDIAVKEIHPDFMEDDWYIDQFQNEARHVARMNHQNIVHIFDLVQTGDKQFYIIMEYIDGIDLSHLMRRGKSQGVAIPAHLSVHIVAEICKALDYAHNCRNAQDNEPLNLVHQDISPSNIMVTKNGSVKLIDFGIAAMQREPLGDTETVTLQGKLQYMSPEHVSSEQVLDKRSDIFSLGLVLYELLEGRRFFQEIETGKIVEALRNGKIKMPGFWATPKPLRKILRKALMADPKKRFQNANQLYIDLVTFLVMKTDTSAIDMQLGSLVADLGAAAQAPAAPSNGSMSPLENGLSGGVPLNLGAADEFAASGSPAAPVASDNLAQPGAPPSGQSPLDPIPSLEPGESNGMADKVSQNLLPAHYFEAGDDEIKTVIDVVRLSARGHKKLILRSSVATAALLLVFALLDISMQWTGFGRATYDFLFPPAIKIASIPAGAEVFLNGEPVAGATPLAIPEIDPGIYELKLALPPYKPIVRSMQVPQKGQARVVGEEIRQGNKPYLFHFRTTLEINSVPPGATVLINGIKFAEKTPCSVAWEIGDRCEIELKKAGFGSLSGFSLDDQMIEEIEDRRLWEYDVEVEPEVRHRVTGRFGKTIKIGSRPTNAQIYLDDNPEAIGQTGGKSGFFLTAEPHTLTLKKAGYNSRKVDVYVREESSPELFFTLTRPVRFVSRDAAVRGKRDLGARLVRLSRGRKVIAAKRKTPFTLNLQPREYSAVFARPGYEELRIDISPTAKVVAAKMRPLKAQFSVVVLDRETNAPLSNVEVRFGPLDKNDSAPESVDVTDLDGTIGGLLPPGLYVFRTSSNGYKYEEQTLMIEAGELNLIEFNLVKESNQ